MLSVRDLVRLVLVLFRNAGFHSVTRMHVIKACYLIEREYFKRRRQRLTDLYYYNYLYGPFNMRIVNVLEEMTDQGVIRRGEDEYTYDISDLHYLYDDRIMKIVSKPILNKVMRIIRKHPYAFDLAEYVHRLPEVRDTPFGEPIRFK